MSRVCLHSIWLGLLLVVVSEAHARPKAPRRAPAPPLAAEAESAPAEAPVAVEPAAPPEIQEPAPAPTAAPEPPKAAVTSASAPATSTSPTDSSSADKAAALRTEVGALMEDLVAARAKAAVLGKALFKTRVVVRVQNLAGAEAVLGRLVVSLDGAAVFRGEGSALQGEEAKQVFEGFVAPGPHTLTVELEQRARADEAFGYTLRQTYRVTAPREKESDLLVILDDDSTLAEDFADDGEGEYDVRTRLRQTTRE